MSGWLWLSAIPRAALAPGRAKGPAKATADILGKEGWGGLGSSQVVLRLLLTLHLAIAFTATVALTLHERTTPIILRTYRFLSRAADPSSRFSFDALSVRFP